MILTWPCYVKHSLRWPNKKDGPLISFFGGKNQRTCNPGSVKHRS